MRIQVEIYKLKIELKALAKEIRDLKSKRKDPTQNNGCGLVNGLVKAQHTTRIKYIAYCLLRGRTLEQIEPKLRQPEGYHHVIVRKQATEIVAKILNPPVEKEMGSGATKDIRPSGQVAV
jgi:hypothetical protein